MRISFNHNATDTLATLNTSSFCDWFIVLDYSIRAWSSEGGVVYVCTMHKVSFPACIFQTYILYLLIIRPWPRKCGFLSRSIFTNQLSQRILILISSRLCTELVHCSFLFQQADANNVTALQWLSSQTDSIYSSYIWLLNSNNHDGNWCRGNTTRQAGSCL